MSRPVLLWVGLPSPRSRWHGIRERVLHEAYLAEASDPILYRTDRLTTFCGRYVDARQYLKDIVQPRTRTCATCEKAIAALEQRMQEQA